mmetsp:Transcript_44966/g.104025  ORF Transcript_44966/g.104025 Transcript_44966/m.104025 type:complete len:368 (+) Transcript_44966:138-1241(+)
MFNRLKELQEAANITEAAPIASLYVGNGKSPLEQALAQDSLIRSEFDGVREKQEQLQELVANYRAETLPRQLQQLAVQFEGTEEVCQKQLTRCRSLLAGLKPSADEAGGSVGQIRSQLEARASGDLMGLMRSYFDLHASFRDERKKRLQRQLHFAFPEATISDLKDAVEFHKVAEQALEMRLAGEAKGRSLNSIRKEIDKTYGDTLELEHGSHEIKMMFFQVAEMVGEQDEILENVETNINQALEDTSEARELLKKAQEAKDAADRNACLRLAFLPWWARLLILAALIWFAPRIMDTVYNLIVSPITPGSFIELSEQEGSLATYMDTMGVTSNLSDMDADVSSLQSAHLRTKASKHPQTLRVAADFF